MPDVRMNQGPLPSVAGGPAGTDGTPDGVINGTNRLLSGITPYAYGESARMGSDSNYQQVPHRVQYIVPPIHLPSWDSTTTHRVCHVVDNGDLAFVLNTRGRQWFGASETVTSIGPGTLPIFGNLEVVNYILACMQVAPARAGNAGAASGGKRSWTKIREHLWKGMFDEEKLDDDDDYLHHMFGLVMYSVENLFKPHGVCAGSEHQGGQHEESWAPVQAAVNYTTTMTVDGQNRDLVNYWHEQGVYAGDRLILRLVLRKGVKTQEYQLTSYYERPVSATVTTERAYWQLEPWVLQADADKVAERYDYRVTGYWHIAQSFQGRQGSGVKRGVPPGAPVQVTFAPVFVRNGKVNDLAWDWIDLLETLEWDGLETAAEECFRINEDFGDINIMTDNLAALGVKMFTLNRIFGRGIWMNMDNNLRLACFATITGLYHLANDNELVGLKRRVVRKIDAIEKKMASWNGMTPGNIEAELLEVWREILGSKYEDHVDYLQGKPMLGGGAPKGGIQRFVFHGLGATAGTAFVEQGVGAEGRALVQDGVGVAGGVALGVEVGEIVQGMDVTRKASKKKKCVALAMTVEEDGMNVS